MGYKISNMVGRFIKQLSKYGYCCVKSVKSPGHSYYFKCRNKLTIRLSDHHLHPSQIIEKTIDVVINENEVSVNDKPIFIENLIPKEIAKIALERIILEHRLYGKPMPLSRRKY